MQPARAASLVVLVALTVFASGCSSLVEVGIRTMHVVAANEASQPIHVDLTIDVEDAAPKVERFTLQPRSSRTVDAHAQRGDTLGFFRVEVEGTASNGAIVRNDAESVDYANVLGTACEGPEGWLRFTARDSAIGPGGAAPAPVGGPTPTFGEAEYSCDGKSWMAVQDPVQP